MATSMGDSLIGMSSQQAAAAAAAAPGGGAGAPPAPLAPPPAPEPPLDAASAAAEAVAAAGPATDAAAMAAMAENHWALVHGLQEGLAAVQAASGLPWWGAIAATTVAVRLATLPVAAMQMRNTANMQRAKPEIEGLVARAKECNERGDSSGALAYSNRIQEVWRTHDCHPAKSFVPILVQAPLFIGFFSALRGMANAGLPSFNTGGALWFPDLCVADAYYGLPIFSGLTFLLTVEAGADGMGADSPNAGKMKNFMRAMAIGLVPLTASMPASVFVYWNTSNVFSLAQVMLFKWGPARRFFNLPDANLLRAGAPPFSAAAAAPPRRVPAPEIDRSKLAVNRPLRKNKGRKKKN